MALTWVPLSAADIAAGDGFDPGADRGRRLKLLLDAYGWAGTLEQVLDAVGERATEHARVLRQAARDGYGPAVDLVDAGVADDFERAVVELGASREELVRQASGPVGSAR